MKILLQFCIPLLLLSCSSSNVRNDYQTRKESDANYEIKRGLTLSPGNDDEKLEHAKYLMVKKNYKSAEKELEEVHADTTIARKYREEALFQLGELNANFLNPHKDNEKALQYYRKLLTEFPETKFKENAQNKINTLKNQLN